MGCGGQTGPATFSCSLSRVPSAPASGRGLCQSRLPWGHALAVVPNLLPEQLTSRPPSRPARPHWDPSAVSWASFSPRPPDHLPVQPHPGLCRPPRLPLRSTSQAPQGVRCLCYAGGWCPAPDLQGCCSWCRPPPGPTRVPASPSAPSSLRKLRAHGPPAPPLRPVYLCPHPSQGSPCRCWGSRPSWGTGDRPPARGPPRGSDG